MRICQVENCNKKHYARGYCRNHHAIFLREGEIKRGNMFLTNEIINCGEYSEICLYGRKREEVARTKIDTEDVEKIKNYCWGARKPFMYVYTTGVGALSRPIMDTPKGLVVDHINHDTLDNRKSNLRNITCQHNLMNRSLNSNNKTGHAGVYWIKSKKHYDVGIKVNYKYIYLGTFDNIIDAISARKKAEKIYFGEFAYES